MRHDVTKLPKWALEHIEALEHELEVTKKLMLGAEWKEDMPVKWEAGLYSHGGIPTHARVLYRLKNGVRITVYFKGDSISVRTYNRLNIQPMASNAVSIGVVE